MWTTYATVLGAITRKCVAHFGHEFAGECRRSRLRGWNAPVSPLRCPDGRVSSYPVAAPESIGVVPVLGSGSASEPVTCVPGMALVRERDGRLTVTRFSHCECQGDCS